MKKTISAALVLALLLSLTACGTEPPGQSGLPEPVTDVTPAPTAEPTPEATPSPTPLPYVNPLSGEPMEEDVSANRPFAIMINNIQQALPQCGVSQAEIVYEIPAEGGVTRMMAIFTDISDIERIGSLRSIRPYYADVGISYDAIVIHAGGSEESYTEMSGYSVDHLDGVLGTYVEGAFYRDPDRMQYSIEHSLFSIGAKLIEAAEDQGFSLTHEGGTYDYGLTFSEDAADQCSDEALYASIGYNSFKTTDFEYDEEDGLYYAFEYGSEYVDDEYDVQMSFKNLLFLTTDVSVIDDVGRLRVRTTGTGDGYFVCGGKCVEITWERETNTDPFRYYLKDVTPLELGVGSTYVGIRPSYGSSVSFDKEAQ